MDDHRNRPLTRRAVLKGAALLAATVVVASGIEARAQAKASKATMQYRDTPNGQQECDNCIQYIPGKTPKAMGACKVVEGEISPKGWCIAYAPQR